MQQPRYGSSGFRPRSPANPPAIHYSFLTPSTSRSLHKKSLWTHPHFTPEIPVEDFHFSLGTAPVNTGHRCTQLYSVQILHCKQRTADDERMPLLRSSQPSLSSRSGIRGSTRTFRCNWFDGLSGVVRITFVLWVPIYSALVQSVIIIRSYGVQFTTFLFLWMCSCPYIAVSILVKPSSCLLFGGA